MLHKSSDACDKNKYSVGTQSSLYFRLSKEMNNTGESSACDSGPHERLTL